MKKFFEGFLYSEKKYQVIEYKPEKLFSDSHFFSPSNDIYAMDCLIHAVNYALRYPYFTTRD